MAERWVVAVARDDSSGATDADLDAAAGALGVELPEDYRALMRRVNGGDGDFGKSWLVLYPVEDLVDGNSTFWFGFRPPLAASVGLAALAILLVVLPMVLPNRRFGKISFF